MVETHRALAAFLRGQSDCAVGGVIGPYEYLSTTRFMTQSGNPAARELLPLASENRTLWSYYAFALGQNRFHQIMDTNYWRSLTTVFLKDANFLETARLMNEVRAYEREHLAPKGVKLGFAGDVALSQSLIRGIVTTQLQSLGWSLAGIFLVTALFGGSWRWGFFCVLPSALAVVIKFAVMGWLGIPLGVATSMFAAMTLGIGVNCPIQLLEAHAQSRAAGGSVGPCAWTDRRARLNQHARRLARVQRAAALTSAGERATRHVAGAWFGKLLRHVAGAVAGAAALVAAETRPANETR